MTTFISYSRVNSDFAVRLAKDLRLAGYDIWLDQLDIPTGARWDDEIERALDACHTFLIVLSPQSIMSQNVKDEVGYAIDSSKHVLPVIVEPCKVPLRLRRFQFVDFTDKPYEDSLAEIKDLLDNIDQTATTNVLSSRPHIEQLQRQMPASKKRSWIWQLVLVVFSICSVVTIGFIVLLLALPRPNIFFPATPVPFVSTTISSLVPSPVPSPVVPTEEPTPMQNDGFTDQESYAGDCANRPAGSVCLKYTDGFMWLIYDSVQDHGDGGLWQGNPVEIVYGFKADYYHVLNTSLVKVVPK